MAGEIEESCSFGFQADSVHSGSISFGRFENESLSWERRSSFSHNRYLEEVEKCSTPGLVIEKKAYFEAHFKKKGLLLPNSFECHNYRECQTSENDVLESREDFEHVSEGSQGSHYACFDESPKGSEYHGEYEVTGCEMKKAGLSFSGPQMESALNNADFLLEGNNVSAGETHQVAAGLDKFLLVNDEPEIKVKDCHSDDATSADILSRLIVNEKPGIEENQNPECEALNAEKSPKATNPSPRTELAAKVDKTSLEHSRNPSSKLRTAMETKCVKPGVKTQAKVVHLQRDISGASSKTPAEKSSRKERENSTRENIEKSSARANILRRPAARSTPISQDSRTRDAKLTHDNKSCEMESRRKKVGDCQASVMKAETRGDPKANRINPSVNSTKADAKAGVSSFSFKSNERAERRKEFYMKLEEKMHAKEAEMNQIQARTQEKTEAEIKQFRKSLNFKAMPMPSFYHVAVTPGSDRKAVSSNNKANKARNKSSNPGIRAAAESKSCLKDGNDQAPYTSESVNIFEPLDNSQEINCLTSKPSEGSAISQIPSTNHVCSPEATAGNGIAGRKEREKKDTGLHKRDESESHKVTKGQRIKGKQNVGAQTSSNETGRKDTKGIGIGSRSGMGHLAVGVAS